MSLYTNCMNLTKRGSIVVNNCFNRFLNKSAVERRKLAHIKAITKTTMSNYTTVSYVTTPNEQVARQISEKLVASKLAACVNIIKGVESIYEWQDKIEHDNEMLLIIKSSSSKTKDLTEFVEKNHPYDCPEVITLKVDSGSEAYLNWVHETINKTPASTTDV